MKIPTENEECLVLVKYLEVKQKQGYLLFSHISNETPTQTLESSSQGRRVWKQNYATTGKLKNLGVRKGVPDYIILLVKRPILLFLEMKRERPILKNGELGKSPSKVYPEQEEWIANLSTVSGVYSKICYGAGEAIEFVQSKL